MRLLRWWKDDWQDPQESCGTQIGYAQDLEYKTISAVVCRSGTYALFVPAYTVFFPVVP
jgi:hypothetical protein